MIVIVLTQWLIICVIMAIKKKKKINIITYERSKFT